MSDSEWKTRLSEAVQKDGRSLRSISLACGLGHGYLHSIFNEGKDPSVARLERICAELGVSVAYILVGIDLSPETERLLNAIEGDPDRRAALLAIFERGQPEESLK